MILNIYIVTIIIALLATILLVLRVYINREDIKSERKYCSKDTIFRAIVYICMPICNIVLALVIIDKIICTREEFLEFANK